MLFMTIRIVIFALGSLCILLDAGCRLFGSYARRPLSQLLRILSVVLIEVIYALPFLAIVVMPDSPSAKLLNILVLGFGISAIAIFLFPVHCGIKSGADSSIRQNAEDIELTPSVALHEEALQINHPVHIKNLNLLVLSDLHCNSDRQLNAIRESINKLNSAKPDLLLILGDLTEDIKYLQPVFQLFQDIETQCGVFLVRGNHDYESNRQIIIEELAKDANVHLLNHQNYYIEELDVTLVGTESPWSKAKIKSKISGLPMGISHSPDNIKEFSHQNLPIVLAGHTHGGKVKIPLIGSVLVSSRYGRFLDYGWFTYRQTSMFITKGFGYFPGISGSMGEILKLTINTKEKPL